MQHSPSVKTGLPPGSGLSPLSQKLLVISC